MAGSGNQQDDDFSRGNIRKLINNDQWETWKWQIELCLNEQCLHTIVDGSRKCPDASA